MSKGTTDARYCFFAEWFDPQAELIRKYHLIYYTINDTIEMYDVKKRRTFLKRCSYPSIQIKDLYVGSKVNVYGRQLHITDYGDPFTRKQLGKVKQSTVIVLQPQAVANMGPILNYLNKNGAIVTQLKMCLLTEQQAASFFGDSSRTERVALLSSGRVVAMEILGASLGSVVEKLNNDKVLVPINVQCQSEGADNNNNNSSNNKSLSSVGHNAQTSSWKIGQESKQSSSAPSNGRSCSSVAEFFFNNKSVLAPAQLTNCTVCVIKPHAIVAGYLGEIVGAIQGAQQFGISAMQIFTLDREAAQEFLEVYKTVVPEYHAMVEQLISGPVVAMELVPLKSDTPVVQAFRQFCGPSDPDIARHIRGNTLRAHFGQNKVKNAVHCTDLPEDGVLEAEYFFSILQA